VRAELAHDGAVVGWSRKLTDCTWVGASVGLAARWAIAETQSLSPPAPHRDLDNGDLGIGCGPKCSHGTLFIWCEVCSPTAPPA
jgi:hypothetical protein